MLFVVALVLNIYRLGQPSIWFDEAFSVELARQPLPLLWHIIFGPEPNMELYYLLLHFWLQLTGALGLLPVEWVVRLPSAFCAALSTVVVFWLGRRYLGRGAGCVAALLYWSTLNKRARMHCNSCCFVSPGSRCWLPAALIAYQGSASAGGCYMCYQ